MRQFWPEREEGWLTIQLNCEEIRSCGKNGLRQKRFLPQPIAPATARLFCSCERRGTLAATFSSREHRHRQKRWRKVPNVGTVTHIRSYWPLIENIKPPPRRHDSRSAGSLLVYPAMLVVAQYSIISSLHSVTFFTHNSITMFALHISVTDTR